MKDNTLVTPYEAAVLSRLAYQAHREGLVDEAEASINQAPIIPAGWELKTDYLLNEEYGLSVTLAVSTLKKAVVFAVRGTANFKNMYANILGIMAHNTNIITRMVKGVFSIIETFREDGFEGRSLILTGHSLGGFIANLVLLRLLKSHPNRFLKAESITFDAPGVGNFYKDKGKDTNEPMYASDQIHLIRNYVSELNYVNACQPHVGNLIHFIIPHRLYVDLEDASLNKAGEALDSQKASIWGAFVGSSTGGSKGSLEGSRTIVEGSARMLAIVAKLGLFSSVKDALWAHSGETIILAFNPRTGEPYQSEVCVPPTYPDLLETIEAKIGQVGLDLFSSPGDKFEWSVVAGAGANCRRGLDASKASPANRAMERYDCALLAGVVCAAVIVLSQEENNFSKVLALMHYALLAAYTYYRSKLAGLSHSLSDSINHAGAIALCNRSLKPEYQVNHVKKELEPSIEGMRRELAGLQKGPYPLLFKVLGDQRYAASVALSPLLSMLLGNPYATVTALLVFLLSMAPFAKVVRTNKAFQDTIRASFSGNVRSKLDLFNASFDALRALPENGF